MSFRRPDHRRQSFSPHVHSNVKRPHNAVFHSSPDRNASQSSHIRFDDSESSSTPSPKAHGVKRSNEQIKDRKRLNRDISSSIPESPVSSLDALYRSISSPIKKRKRLNDIEAERGSSPFFPDAVSTPVLIQARATAPVLIPSPVDPPLTDAYIKARRDESRKESRKSMQEQIFRARIPSSSPSENDDEQRSQQEDIRRKKKEKKKVASQPNATGSKGRQQTQTDTTKKTRKPRRSPEKVEHSSKIDTTLTQTTKQINAKLESDLLASLIKILPSHLVSHARAQLTEEVREVAKSSTGNHDYPANSCGPSDRAVTIRAARDLIVRQSATKLANASDTSKGNQDQNGNDVTRDFGSICIESHLARIASDRAKRIEVLGMEVRGLKMRLNDQATGAQQK